MLEEPQQVSKDALKYAETVKTQGSFSVMMGTCLMGMDVPLSVKLRQGSNV